VIYFVSDLQTSDIYKHLILIKFDTILSDVIYFVSDSDIYKHLTLIKFHTILSDVIYFVSDLQTSDISIMLVYEK